MSVPAPSFSLGIEEEYLLVDLETRDLAEAPDALMANTGWRRSLRPVIRSPITAPSTTPRKSVMTRCRVIWLE